MNIIVIGLLAIGIGAEPVETKESRVVIRISKELVRKHVTSSIERVSPIDKCLFGAHVSGVSTTRGVVGVRMSAQDRAADFVVDFRGATISNTVAVKNPVAVYSTGYTTFEVQRRIRFDGSGFVEEPSTIAASYCSTINAIATPGGLRGRFVRRRAIPQIEEHQPAAAAIALADTESHVLGSFNEETDGLAEKLNKKLAWQETLKLLMPESKDLVFHLRTTEDYLVAARGPREAGVPVLPVSSNQPGGLIEIWIRGKTEGESSRELLKAWTQVHLALDAFRTQKPAKIEGVVFTAVDDWWVIKVGEDFVEKQIEKK